jgi:hypothetical protein
MFRHWESRQDQLNQLEVIQLVRDPQRTANAFHACQALTKRRCRSNRFTFWLFRLQALTGRASFTLQQELTRRGVAALATACAQCSALPTEGCVTTQSLCQVASHKYRSPAPALRWPPLGSFGASHHPSRRRYTESRSAANKIIEQLRSLQDLTALESHDPAGMALFFSKFDAEVCSRQVVLRLAK